jgi:hypothetical protein
MYFVYFIGGYKKKCKLLTALFSVYFKTEEEKENPLDSNAINIGDMHVIMQEKNQLHFVMDYWIM